MLAYFLVWLEKPRFYGQAYLKTLALTGLTRPRFPGKPGQDLGKPGHARLGRACHAFDHTPDARVPLSLPDVSGSCFMPKYKLKHLWLQLAS